MAHITDIIKYEGDGNALIWKHPCEDFNTKSQLIVHEGQEAIFFMDGQALDIFGPGRHTLETNNIPLVGKFLNRFTGGESPFHCEVYFVNKLQSLSEKWGTDNRVGYKDPRYNDIRVEIGASGELGIVVSNAKKILLNFVGTKKGISWSNGESGFAGDLYKILRFDIMNIVKSNIGEAIKQNDIDIVEVNSHLSTISNYIRTKLDTRFEDYGISFARFSVNNIVINKDANYEEILKLNKLALGGVVRGAETADIIDDLHNQALIQQEKDNLDAQLCHNNLENTMRLEEINRAVKLEEGKTQIALTKQAAEINSIKANSEAEQKFIKGQADIQLMQMHGYADAEIMSAKGSVQAMGSTFDGQMINFAAYGLNPNDIIECSHCKKIVFNGKYCMKCGKQLSIKCPKCENINLPDSLFCNKCGTKL